MSRYNRIHASYDLLDQIFEHCLLQYHIFYVLVVSILLDVLYSIIYDIMIYMIHDTMKKVIYDAMILPAAVDVESLYMLMAFCPSPAR